MSKNAHVDRLRLENRLLAALPREEFKRLTARMDDVSFKIRDVVYRANGPIHHVYFPRTGVISMVITMQDGGTVEVATVGNEGMVGVPVLLGTDRSSAEVFCQIPAESRRMRVAVFDEEVRREGPFRQLVQRYAQALFNQVSQTAACNRLHSTEERCARWLLVSHDRVQADEFPLTQEFLAVMLGTHRPSVTLAAGILQKAGLIRYSRGRITILDRAGLEAVSCECYRVTRSELDHIHSPARGWERPACASAPLP
jgi:CRP-like cAMP-binding protein